MNEITLSNDLNVLTTEIFNYQQLGGQVIFEIGKRLKHIKENDLVHGEWTRYCEETLKTSRYYVNKYIKVYEKLKDTDRNFSFGLNKMYEIATMEDEQREQAITKGIPTDEGYKSIEKATQKEMSIYKRNAEEAEQRAIKAEQAKQQAETQAQAERKERERLERENEELANRDPEIREVVIEDETKINELQSRLKSFQEKIDLLEREKNKNADDLNAFNSLKDQINSLYTEKDDVIRQIESAGTIGKFIAKVEKSFQDDLAPIKYTRALRESADNEAVIKAVDDILKMVEDWVLEIRKEVPETIKYTEVIDHE